MAKIKQISLYALGIAAFILLMGFNLYIDAWFMGVRMDWFGF